MVAVKKTYVKTIYREIKKSFGRFAAIFAIVALGVGFLSGLLITTPDMHVSVDEYYDKNRMTDIFIKGTLGLTEEDIKAVSTVDEVEQIMPAYVTDILMETNTDQTLVARVYGLPIGKLENDNESFINRLELIEGRLPQDKKECLLERGGIYRSDVEVGTVLTISEENDDYENIGDIYNTTQYTVVGIVSNPFYFSTERESSSIGNGQVGTILYVDESNYNLDVYTDFYITLKGAKELTAFSDKYETYVEEVVTKLEKIGETQSVLRSAEIIDEAREELEQGKEDYAKAKNEAESELASALQELEDGKKALASAEGDLKKAKEELNNGEAALAEEQEKAEEQLKVNEEALFVGKAALEQAKETLAQSKAQLDAVKEDIEQAKALLASGVPLPDEILRQIEQYDAGVEAYQAGMAEVRAKEAEIESGKAILAVGKKEAEERFAQAEAKLKQGRLDLKKGETELEKGKQELTDGERKYEVEKAKAEEELRKAEHELAQAEDKINEIKDGKWYVLDRNFNVSYASFSFNSDKVAAIAKVFPIFFLLVAALVALTTMTRMVEEERTQIGMLKALGYSKGSIMSKYIIYCGLASILGCAVGLVTGFQLLPKVIWNAYATIYHLPNFIAQFSWSFSLIASVVAVLCTMAATISACNQALKEKPAQLMLPRAPKAGKRIFLERIPFIWNHLKFSYKATARNLLRYKKHFFMTVIGVAGCTAMIVAGVGLRDSLGNISNIQFDKIIQYDLTITLKESNRENNVLGQFLNNRDQVETSIEAFSETGKALVGEEKLTVSIFVPKDPAQLQEVISLKERKSQKPIPFNDTSVILVEKLAETLELGIGDSFTYENAEGKAAEFIVSGITENYVGTYIYINPEDYAYGFEEEPFYNTLLVKSFITDEKEKDQVLTSILDSDTVSNAQFTSQTKETYDKLLSSINYIVIVIILAAGALAIIVLYNLTNININERNKELATLRVLGFHHHEVGSYIFREITILSIIGTLVGLVLGVFLFTFVILTAESPEFMFGRDLSLTTFVLSAVITLFFSMIVDGIMYQKLKKVEMVESLKAVD